MPISKDRFVLTIQTSANETLIHINPEDPAIYEQTLMFGLEEALARPHFWLKVQRRAQMDSNTPHPKQDRDHSAHGCCGGTHKQPVKQKKTETGCGCDDRHTKQKETSSCCG